MVKMIWVVVRRRGGSLHVGFSMFYQMSFELDLSLCAVGGAKRNNNQQTKGLSIDL